MSRVEDLDCTRDRVLSINDSRRYVMREQHFRLTLNRAQVILVLLCAFLPLPGLAGTFTAFGRQTYERSTGQPQTVVTDFTVLNPNTSYTIQVFKWWHGR